MANTWTQDDITIYKNVIKSFEDNLNVSLNVSVHGENGELMERGNDIIRRPIPMITTSANRTVGSALATRDVTDLYRESQLDVSKSVPLTLNAKEGRDKRRWTEMQRAAGQRLASDIEQSVQAEVGNLGSLVVAQSALASASGYDEVAECESLMLEIGIDTMERCLALNARDYNGLAGDLSKASRSLNNPKSLQAYERSYIGDIAGFDSYKLGTTINKLGAAGSSATMDTTGTLVQFAPAANQDNTTQQITVTTTTGVVAGDAFTVAGLNAVNLISKQSTNQPKTFRVVSVDSGTTMTITPPMIGGGGGTDPEVDYQNIDVASTSATAAITYINTQDANYNYFWTKDSIEILAGRYAVPTDEGVKVMKGTTDQGIELCMTKEFSGSTFTGTYYFDIFYGVTNLDPQKNGILLFGQT